MKRTIFLKVLIGLSFVCLSFSSSLYARFLHAIILLDEGDSENMEESGAITQDFCVAIQQKAAPIIASKGVFGGFFMEGQRTKRKVIEN